MLFEWVFEIMKDRKEYLSRLYQEQKVERREKNLEAVKRYNEREMKKDPEGFKERKREINKVAAKKYYEKKRANMTPEELEEIRRKNRERVAAIRAKKKLEKLNAEKSEKSEK